MELDHLIVVVETMVLARIAYQIGLTKIKEENHQMNEEDIKLTELAAKVIGIPYKWNPEEYTFWWYDKEECCAHIWNPLLHNGDAFNLMIMLKMVVDTDYNCGVIAGNSVEEGIWIEVINGNVAAATRRAIVTLAAKIGEKL